MAPPRCRNFVREVPVALARIRIVVVGAGIAGDKNARRPSKKRSL